MTDPIADMLTRIRNAIAVNKDTVDVPYSSMKSTILDQLVKSGFIPRVQTEGQGVKKQLKVTLSSKSEPAKISSLSRISKPGQRVYSKSGQVPKAKNGRGIILVSTSKGVISDIEARKQNLGGELICQVY